MLTSRRLVVMAGYPGDQINTEFGPEADRYRFGAQLAKGGQGTVYVCTRISTGNKYAVKVINTDRPAFKRQRGDEKLRQEIRNMEELHHRNIVNLMSHIFEQGRCLLIMDLAALGDLHNKVQKEREDRLDREGEVFAGLGRSELASKHVSKQLLDGMGYMHSNNIVHRDMKLENVLIVNSEPFKGVAKKDPVPTELLNIKITDFGLSKSVRKGGELQRKQTIVGTPDFVAPEVLEGSYNHLCDFWSFGVIIFTMLCAEWPFRINADVDLQPERHKDVCSNIKENSSWNAASEEVRSLVRGLLTIDVHSRLGYVECLHHAWLAADDGPTSPKARAVSMGDVDGVVQKIAGRTGWAIDSLVLSLSDGSEQSFGDKGGETEYSYKVKEDEMITAVMQEHRNEFLGNSIYFQTSHGRTIVLEGSQSRHRRCFVAPPGCQIVGLQFQSDLLIGIHLAPGGTAEKSGSVASVSGHCGAAVDRVLFSMRDGSQKLYGESVGGTEHGPWNLEPSELIVSVEQLSRAYFLGTSIVFTTSLGRIIQLAGMQVSCRRFAVARGHQICGLEFEGSDLSVVTTCPSSGDLSNRQSHKVS